MPEPTVWYEIIGYYRPTVSRRLVSSETACYVFHPNGRKSSKGSNRGTDWHKTFAEAKAEMIRRAMTQIESAEQQLARAKAELDAVLKIEDPAIKAAKILEAPYDKAESNITSAVANGPAI